MSGRHAAPTLCAAHERELADIVWAAPEPPSYPKAPTPASVSARSRANKNCEACGEGGRYVVASKCRSCGHMMGEPVRQLFGVL